MKLQTINDLGDILGHIPGGGSLEVEIGCGNGHFLSEYCERNRISFLLGLEIKSKRCIKALAKIKQKQLDNAAVICTRAEEFLKAVPESLVDRYHIYFPDPWPKTKHRKRRFLRLSNLELLYRSMKSGGVILFTSDFFDYYLQAKILFLLHPGFEPCHEQPPEEIFISIYGKKFKGLGIDSYTIAVRKRSANQIMPY